MEQSPEKLMTNQFITNQKINDLLELASEFIECGPECQENKKSKELYDKYVKSQTYLKMAPDKLENNKKNYYVYTYGPEYYEDIKKKEISENSSEIINKISDEFNSQVENALMMNTLLETTDPKLNCSDQYPIIQKKLNYELHKKTNNMLINNRETYYSNETIKNLEYWNKFWSFIYYFLIFIFLILCFPKTKYDFIRYGIVIGFAFLYILIVNHSSLFLYSNKFKIIISIIYFIILLIIILFILYKIATTFKYILINLTDTMTKIYRFSEK
jgi:hypothetical protein